MSNSHNEQEARQSDVVEVPVKVLEGIFKDLDNVVGIVAMHKEYLLNLSEGIGADPNRVGICHHLREFWQSSDLLKKTSPPLDIVRELSPFWSEYSGDCNYPVPYKQQYESAEEAYEDSSLSEFWSGEYGDSRKRLCKFLADQLGQLLLLVENGSLGE